MSTSSAPSNPSASSTPSTPTTDGARGVRFDLRNKIGFCITLLMGFYSAASAVLDSEGGQGGSAEPGPPVPVVVAAVLLALVMTASVVHGWARGSRRSIRVAAVAMALAMLSALPALFVEGIPAATRAGVGVALLLTITAVFLMLTPARPDADRR